MGAANVGSRRVSRRSAGNGRDGRRAVRADRRGGRSDREAQVNEPCFEPCRVVYSERVRQRMRELAQISRGRGDGLAFLAALKEFHRRLIVYPQFGEPLTDLVHESGQIRIGIVPPLSMRYAVYDDRRL